MSHREFDVLQVRLNIPKVWWKKKEQKLPRQLISQIRPFYFSWKSFKVSLSTAPHLCPFRALRLITTSHSFPWPSGCSCQEQHPSSECRHFSRLRQQRRKPKIVTFSAGDSVWAIFSLFFRNCHQQLSSYHLGKGFSANCLSNCNVAIKLILLSG